jgi:nitrogen fixation/metabolism regulation signal transduction histidine kinase
MSEPRSADRQAQLSRGLRWTLGFGVVAALGIALVLLLLLTQATQNQNLYEQTYRQLFVLNLAIAGFLGLVMLWIAVRLGVRLKKGKFGSRLLIKLAGIFAVVGFLPGILIYVVSYQFVSRSIESWFDVKVEGALASGLTLGQSSLDALANDLGLKTRAAANQLGEMGDAQASLALERVRESLAASDVVLWSSNGQPIAAAGPSQFSLRLDRPSTAQLRAARSQRFVTQVDGLDEAAEEPARSAGTGGPARVRALAQVSGSGFGLNAETRFLSVVQALPKALVANALAVQEANREYQERALARQGLKRMYLGTLTLSLFLAVFAAVLLAIALGNQLVRPLLLVADGVRQVTSGDLSPKAVSPSRDELGNLTRSFADMTQQLADARAQVQRSLGELGAARERLQTILDNQNNAVLLLDRDGNLTLANPSATQVLRCPVAAYLGKPISDLPNLEAFSRTVLTQFDEFEHEDRTHTQDHWQQALALAPDGSVAQHHTESATHYILRGALLGDGQRLLVVDDISEVVSNERTQAWGEVARRLAHEIKNPLTPIQLSAERLQRKLDGKLEGSDRDVLNKSVNTIVDQVDAMKRLVNEFRDYARLPQAQLQPVDLNSLVADVLQLYAQTATPVTVELDPRVPPIQGDMQQLRQVLHNLVQNAQDAAGDQRTASDTAAQVSVKTRYSESGQRVRLIVADNGPGFADHILKRAFEPYVTTKAKGTGLGLAVVKKIADEHGARIELANRELDGRVAGAQVSLSFMVANSQQPAQLLRVADATPAATT